LLLGEKIPKLNIISGLSSYTFVLQENFSSIPLKRPVGNGYMFQEVFMKEKIFNLHIYFDIIFFHYS